MESSVNLLINRSSSVSKDRPSTLGVSESRSPKFHIPETTVTPAPALMGLSLRRESEMVWQRCAQGKGSGGLGGGGVKVNEGGGTVVREGE
jgi:hypothetical protein